METDYSEQTHFPWKIKWRLEHLGALGSVGDTAPLTSGTFSFTSGTVTSPLCTVVSSYLWESNAGSRKDAKKA